MYADKEEAEKCIVIAEKSMQSGNIEKALRFLEKAERFYPTDRAKELMEKVKNMSADSNEHLRHRTRAAKNEEQPVNASDNKENDVSQKEHIDAVKRIKNCKDYYEVLGVSKDATNSKIKKAYKKLALLLHPDKNKTPGAAEAFKAIGNAVAVLTDPEKRKQYDMYECDEEKLGSQTVHRNGDHHYHSYTRGFEADITAEELFNMFFGGGFPNNQNVYGRRSGRWPRQESAQAARQQQSTTFILHLLPILLLIVLSMMSSFYVSDPIFSLHASSKFPVLRKTQNLKVPYFVKENFNSEYQNSINRLELTVEEEYKSNLRNACYKERAYRDSMIYKAQNLHDRDMLRRAQNQPLPSCEALIQLHEG